MVAAAKLKELKIMQRDHLPYAQKMSEIVNSLVRNKGEKEFKYEKK